MGALLGWSAEEQADQVARCRALERDSRCLLEAAPGMEIQA
jgi:glycerol-3-phosphate dehydrogenase